MGATKEGIVEIGDRYYYYEDELPFPYEVKTEVFLVKTAVVKQEVTGYDSTSTERFRWQVFEDADGNKYSVRDSKSWVRKFDTVEKEDEENIVDIEFQDDLEDPEKEHEFVEENIDI